MYNYKNISIHRLGHDGFLIGYKGKNICIDPFEIKETLQADHIFLTHNHRDHPSLDDIQKIIKNNTIIICPSICEENLMYIQNKKIFINQNENLNLDDFSIKTIPTHNTNKFRSPGVPYHPKESGFVGYIFDFDGTKVYHAGDTDIIPEMENLYPDIALIPVSGIYRMTAQEATNSINIIKPQIVIPMHYDSIVGKSMKNGRHGIPKKKCKLGSCYTRKFIIILENS